MKREQNKAIEDLVEYIKKAKGDPTILNELCKNPIEVLKSQNIIIEDEFKEAVISQFDALDAVTETSMMPAPPKSLRIEETTVDQSPAKPPVEVINAIDFMIKPWGVVLILREPAVKWIQAGNTISATTLGLTGFFSAIAAGPVGVGVGIIMEVITAALAVNGAIMSLVDNGKGVYLTWTWLNVVMFPHPLSSVPITTPIV